MKDLWKWVAGAAVAALLGVAVLSFSMGRSAVTQDDLDAVEAHCRADLVELEGRIDEKLAVVGDNTRAIEKLTGTLAETNLLLRTHGITFDNLRPFTTEEGP